jgi:hypothetical protein
MSEWFAARGVPMPKVAAATLYLSGQFLNEVVEQHNGTEKSAATAIDILVFDPASILLFEIDGVARFFSRKVRGLDWSPLASVTIPNGQIQNNGQLMAYKVAISRSRGIEALTVLGITGQVGAMKSIGKGHSIGVAGGVEGVDRVIDPLTQLETVKLTPSAGLYWDRDDSLMGSVLYGRTTENDLSVNLYPGVLPGPARRIGLWFVHTRSGQVRFGLATTRSLGLGLGFGSR